MPCCWSWALSGLKHCSKIRRDHGWCACVKVLVKQYDTFPRAVVEIHCTVINEKVKSRLVPNLYLHILWRLPQFCVYYSTLPQNRDYKVKEFDRKRTCIVEISPLESKIHSSSLSHQPVSTNNSTVSSFFNLLTALSYLRSTHLLVRDFFHVTYVQASSLALWSHNSAIPFLTCAIFDSNLYLNGH